MATNQNDGQDVGHGAGQSAAPDYVFDGTSAAIVVPVGDALLNAEYSRSGPDLILETPDGKTILITDYFSQQLPPDLFTLAGSRITADVAAKLAGPRAPGQVAQNGDGATLEEPIGTVDTIKGTITVIRADGTQVTLTEGDQLFQGDTLASGPDSAIGIIFADKSTMSMAANARIILDELIYDPQDVAQNSQVFNVIQGAFMFTSGAIGKANPEDVSVKTPVATIGIRGTKFGVNVDALDGSTNVTIFEGAVFVQNGAGSVLLTGIGETTLISSYSVSPSDPKVLGLDEIQRLYGDAIGFHPSRQDIPDDHASNDDDLDGIADDLDDIETAAGGDQQGGQGASEEFGKIGTQGVGESGLGGTPPAAGGGLPLGGQAPIGEGLPGTTTGEEGEDDTPGLGGSTITTIDPGTGFTDPETGVTHFTPATPLTSGASFAINAPAGGGIQQLHLNAEQVGASNGGNSTLTLQSGNTPDTVQSGNNSVSLSSTDGMNLTINGFEELALTLGGGNDSIDIQDLSGTSIIADTVTIDAGDGDDVITTSDGVTSTSLVVHGGEGNDAISGSELDDELFGDAGNDIIQAGAGNDFVSGGTGDDVLVGATGNDTLEGNEDNDQLFGFGGDDTLLGGDGDDLLEGGSGSDTVDGGAGDDKAIFVVGQQQTAGVNDVYIGGTNSEEGGDTLVINFDTDVLANAVFKAALLEIRAMLGGAAFGSPEEIDPTPFQALGVDIQGFETIELDGPSFALLPEAEPTGAEDGSILLNLAVTDVLPGKTVTVTIGNLNGATLSAGIDNGDGTFTLTAAELEGLTVTPPANSAVDLDLSISVTTEDEFGNFETTGETLGVAVTPVADTPVVTAGPVAGDEDSAIALNFSASVSDQDGSEELTVVSISGFPPETAFSAGTISEGVLLLDPADLPGLTMTPPPNYSGTINLTLSVTATDSDAETDASDTATTTVEQITVTVAGVADAPGLTAENAATDEDTPVALTIAASLNDESEALSNVTITGFPPNTAFSAGAIAGGVLTLSAGDLAGLVMTPPANFSGNITLVASVTSSDGADSATTVTEFTVMVGATGDAPVLNVGPASGLEDQAINLTISAALTDQTETLSDVTISGLNGATLTAGTVNEDGSVTLTAAELIGLQLIPPQDFSGQINLTVSVTSTDGETQTTTTKGLAVSVEGVADTPDLTVANAAGSEDQPIDLDISAALTDASETLSGITISGHNGATLSAGTVNGDGSVTLTAEELVGLQLTPPANFSGNIVLTVSVTSTDGDSESTAVTDLTVSIVGVADAPELAVADAQGNENTSIPLDLSAALTDTDGSENLTVTITDLPEGAVLSAGTIDPETGSVTLTVEQLAGLKLTPAPGSVDDFSLTVTATSTETDGASASTVGTIDVTVTGTAGEAVLTVQEAAGTEDNAIPLSISVADVETNDTAEVKISNIPTGSTLSTGTIVNGIAILTVAQLANLTITPPANSNDNFELTVTVTTTDNESGAQQVVSGILPVSVSGDADTPSLTVGNVTGSADSPIALNIQSALTDLDGSEELTVTISGLPEGAGLVDGDGIPVASGDGEGNFVLSANQLSGLFVVMPQGSTGTSTLTVTATSTEADGDSESVAQTFTVDITAGTAGKAVLSVAEAEGLEDNAIPLNISVSAIEADDTAEIILSGIPTGAVLKDAGGSVVPIENGSAVLSPDDLVGLTVTPPANSDADFDLTVTVVTTDTGSGQQETVTETLAVVVTPVADAPLLQAANVTGDEDVSIPLNLSAALGDLDGSEILTGIKIAGLPAGATLSAGSVQPDGSVALTAAQLQGLTLKAPANFSGDIQLSISATSIDNGADSATAVKDFTVTVTGVADIPTLVLNDTSGSLAAQIPVDITSALTDLDGSEKLTVIIGGLNGATLSAGTVNDDGTVTLTADQLDGLMITPGPNTIGAINLTVTATATELDGDTASVTGSLTISVADTSTVILVPGQDLDLVAPESDNPNDVQKLVIDAGFDGATTADDWIISQDEFGRVTITNTLTGQLVTTDGYEEIDIDFGPASDTVELRNLSNTDLIDSTLTISTGDGDDTVIASEDVNRNLEIHGGAGNDFLEGSNRNDLIDGGADDDILTGGEGADALDGGDGSDTYLWSEGDGVDTYNDTGETGTDTIVSQSATFEGIGDGFNAAQSGIEGIGRDSNGDGDVDTGTPLLIALSDSSETVNFSGLDFLNSQTTINLGGGNDTVTTSANSGNAVTYIGGEGQDTLNLLMTADSLNQMISAGQLALLQSYIASPQNAELTLTSPNIVAQGFETVRIGVLSSDGTVTDVTDTLSGAISDNQGIGETIFGTEAADLVFAGGGNDVVRTFGGEDAIFGGAGEDYLNAGDDDDYVDGGTGNDIIDGGQGNDHLIGGEGADIVSGGEGDDQIYGNTGNDILAGFAGNDYIEGGEGNDNLSGGSGDDTLLGGEGNDRLIGGSGNDMLIGGEGIDYLDGQTGDDVLIADDFEDQLFGGSGNDILISSLDELPTSPISSGAHGAFAGIRDGGSGIDTFRLNADDLGPHSLSGDEFSHIRNIETLDLSGVDQLQLSLRVEDVVTMTDEQNDLTILLGENVTSVQIEDETIQLENGLAVFQQDGVQITLQQQQPAPEA